MAVDEIDQPNGTAAGDVMRMNRRFLTEEEKVAMGEVKELGARLHATLTRLGDSRELDVALVRIEEAVMWAVKHITGGTAR